MRVMPIAVKPSRVCFESSREAKEFSSRGAPVIVVCGWDDGPSSGLVCGGGEPEDEEDEDDSESDIGL